jgi:hypothetical protein
LRILRATVHGLPGGIALGVYALIALEGATLAMVALYGAEIFVGGIGLFYTGA